MEEIAKDERAGVQKAWAQFEKRIEKTATLEQAHHEKLHLMHPIYPFRSIYCRG